MNTVQHLGSGIDVASQPSFFRAVGLTTEALGWPVVPEALAKFAAMDGHPDLPGVVNALKVFGYEARVHTVTPEALALAALPAIVVTLQGHSLVVYTREQEGSGWAYGVSKVGESGDPVRVALPESRVGGLTGAALIELSRPPAKKVASPEGSSPAADPRATRPPSGTVTTLRQPVGQVVADSPAGATAPELRSTSPIASAGVVESVPARPHVAPPLPTGAPSQSSAQTPIAQAAPKPQAAVPPTPKAEPLPRVAAATSQPAPQAPAAAPVAPAPSPQPAQAVSSAKHGVAETQPRSGGPQLAPVQRPAAVVAAPPVTPTPPATATVPPPAASASRATTPVARPSTSTVAPVKSASPSQAPSAASAAAPLQPSRLPPGEGAVTAAAAVSLPSAPGNGGAGPQQSTASAHKAEPRYLDTLHASASEAATGETDKLCLALALVTGLLGHALPAETFAEGARRRTDGRVDVRDVLKNLQGHDFYARMFNCPLEAIPANAFPMVLFRKNGDATVALARLPITGSGISYQMWLPELRSATVVAESTLGLGLDGACLFIKAPFSKAEAQLARLKLMYADLALEYRALKDANLPKP